MKNVFRVGVLLTLAIASIDTEGCSTACIRHTDCASGEQCVLGTCIVVVTPDGATSVDAMTPAASSTTTPSATTTAPPAATGTPSSTMDGGTSNSLKDASLDAWYSGF
ncbi:MAG TPA: hypothetical protein VHC69_00720 [Polyangiaceae bacterium]|nr:hypothetical protein [Polyangiaceae bacterium]